VWAVFIEGNGRGGSPAAAMVSASDRPSLRHDVEMVTNTVQAGGGLFQERTTRQLASGKCVTIRSRTLLLLCETALLRNGRGAAVSWCCTSETHFR
jgi:hypothetical protein